MIFGWWLMVGSVVCAACEMKWVVMVLKDLDYRMIYISVKHHTVLSRKMGSIVSCLFNLSRSEEI